MATTESDQGAPEKLVRRAALLLVPLLLGAVFLLRSEKPAPTAPVASASQPAPRPPTSAPPASATAAPLRAFSDERALAAPERIPTAPVPPPPPIERTGVPAVDLPLASASPPPRSTVAAPSVPASPCGGLFVRLITVAADPKVSFASMATSYGAPAQVVHVGDRIGGFRVAQIEWDRVWVQSGGGRCAVGMHFGARDAEEHATKELSGEAYAALPWVLPQSIVDGLSKRSEMEFELAPAAIAALYARGADVFAGLRVKVVEDTEEGEGARLELFDIRIDSFLERLGIENKDVLVAINEEPVDSIDAVVKALEAARDKESFTADFTRDGEPFRLSLRLLRPEP